MKMISVKLLLKSRANVGASGASGKEHRTHFRDVLGLVGVCIYVREDGGSWMMRRRRAGLVASCKLKVCPTIRVVLHSKHKSRF